MNEKVRDAIAEQITERLGIACGSEWTIMRVVGVASTSHAASAWEKDRTDEVPHWGCSVVFNEREREIETHARKSAGGLWWWTINVQERSFIVMHFSEGEWHEYRRYAGSTVAFPRPFDEVQFDLRKWWKLAGLSHDGRMTIADLHAMGEEARMELIDGVMYELP